MSKPKRETTAQRNLTISLFNRCFAAVVEPWRLARPIGEEYPELEPPPKPAGKRKRGRR